MIGQTTRGTTGLRRNLRAPTIIGRIRHRQTCSLIGHRRMIAPIRLLRTRSRIVRPTTIGQRMSATIDLRPRGRHRPAQASSRISSERCSRHLVNSSRRGRSNSSPHLRWSVNSRHPVNSSSRGRSNSTPHLRCSVTSRRPPNSTMEKHTNAKSSKRRPGVHIELIPVAGLPEVREGDDLARLIFRNARTAGITLRDRDIVVIAQKIVSKAEGRLTRLSAIKPSARASQLASKEGRDPRLVEIILRESRRIVREHPVLIVETHHGFVCANAGVAHSNVSGEDGDTPLPTDPDGSARLIAATLRKLSKKRVAAVLSATFGRAWRLGLHDG